IYTYKNKKSWFDTAIWSRYFLLGVFFSGTLWGIAGMFVDPTKDIEHWFFVLFILTGLSGGSLAHLSPNSAAYSLFVVPTLLPLTVLTLIRDNPHDQVMAGLVLLFMILTIVMSVRNYRFITSTIQIKFENQELLKQLQISNAELKEHNLELSGQHKIILNTGEEIYQANTLLENILNTTYVLYAQLDKQFNYIRVNRAFADANGHLPDFFTGKNYFDLFPDEENKRLFQQVIQTRKTYHMFDKVLHSGQGEDNAITYWDWVIQTTYNDNNEVDGLLLSLIDVTEQKNSQLALQEKEEYLRSIMETALDAIVTMHEDGTIDMANPAVQTVFGYSEEELIGQNISLLMPESYRHAHSKFVSEYIETNQPKVAGRKIETKGQKADGTIFPLEVSVSEAWVHDHRIFTGIMRDITEEKKLLENLTEKNRDLEFISIHDSLTGIYNRRYADEILEKECARALRKGEALCVIIIDIDYFKHYNDSYGHQAGDKCLSRVARAMHACLKRPFDVLARYGGEEFIIILPETPIEGACHVAEQMRNAIEELDINHKQSSVCDHVTISAGVSELKPAVQECRYEVLVRMADKALYKAKGSGRNQVQFEIVGK
ncbi:MAG: diguanylate cyclase, partial [Gammaproteobacteria bacterium]|nr:diguanylate cyclase [Gammaproteobacteria bacterium]